MNDYLKILNEEEFHEKIEEDIKRIYPENLQDIAYTNYRNLAIKDADLNLCHKKSFKFLTNNYSFYYNNLNHYSRLEKKKIARALYNEDCEIDTISKLLNITPKTARVYARHLANSESDE